MPTLLTDKIIRTSLAEARKPGAKRIVLRDSAEPGLRFVAGPRGGVWTFSTTVRQNGARRESFTTIGPVETVSLAAARLEARKLKDDLRAGLDPRAERELAQARATTLGREADAFMPKGRALHIATDRGHLRLALAELGLTDQAPEKLTRRDLLRLVELHRDRPATARHRIGAVRRFLDSLVNREILEVNPARLLPHGALPRPPAARQGYPSAPELQRLWAAAEALKPEHRDFVRLLILCPLRRGEAQALTAAEVDLTRGEIRLPPSKTKNGQPFSLPLSDAALAILKPRLEGLAGPAGFDPESRLFSGFDMDKVARRWRALAEVPAFNMHDTRRLFASECGEHSIGTFDDVDGLLAHAASASRGGVSGMYNRSKRSDQRRQIMQAWADLVMHAVEHGAWPRELAEKAKIVPLRKRRKGDSAPD